MVKLIELKTIFGAELYTDKNHIAWKANFNNFLLWGLKEPQHKTTISSPGSNTHIKKRIRQFSSKIFWLDHSKYPKRKKVWLEISV